MTVAMRLVSFCTKQRRSALIDDDGAGQEELAVAVSQLFHADWATVLVSIKEVGHGNNKLPETCHP